jgi:hypothetical protein
MISVYLSAAFRRASEVNRFAYDLRRDGVGIVSTWHRSSTGPTDADLDHAGKVDAALQDLDDLESADALCLFGDAPGAYDGQGGKWCEFGYALGMGIHIVVVGHREGIFTHLPGVVYCEDPEAAKSYLRTLRRNSSGKVRAA